MSYHNTSNKTADSDRRLRIDRRLVLRATLAVVLVGLIGVAITTVVGADEHNNPTISVDNATVAPNQTTTVGVALSEAPNGVAGYQVVVSVDNQTVAAITEASITDSFGFQNTNRSDGQVTLVASDTNSNVESGATDILLGTLTLSSQETGRTPLTVQVNQFDDDNGAIVNTTTQSGTLVVESETSNETDDGGTDDGATDDGTTDDGGTDDGTTDDGGTDETDEGTDSSVGISQMGVVGVVILAVIAGYLLLRTQSDDDDGQEPPPR